jgi:glycosyltransferase involved in cell wall biosynthesis
VNRSLRLAIVTESISHFEIPLFKILHRAPGIESRAFYLQPYQEGAVWDSSYRRNIAWGFPLEGFPAKRFDDLNALAEDYSSWKVDVSLVYGYSWKGAWSVMNLNRRLGIPQLFRGTLSYHYDRRRLPWSYLTRIVRNEFLRKFDAYHYGGDYSRRVLLGAGAKGHQLFFVPYSVDSEHFIHQLPHADTERESLRNSLGWNKNHFVVLFIGQHTWFKGPEVALKVFIEFYKRRNHARLLLVGSGAMTGQLLRMAEKRLPKDAYHYAGYVSSSETAKYYFASDIVLFTSRYETWGRAINEAMLCGRPCIVNPRIAAAGGLVCDRSNGYVVRKPDLAHYVDALSVYDSLPDGQKGVLQRNAREKACFFSYERHREALIESVNFANTCRASGQK